MLGSILCSKASPPAIFPVVKLRRFLFGKKKGYEVGNIGRTLCQGGDLICSGAVWITNQSTRNYAPVHWLFAGPYRKSSKVTMSCDACMQPNFTAPSIFLFPPPPTPTPKKKKHCLPKSINGSLFSFHKSKRISQKKPPSPGFPSGVCVCANSPEWDVYTLHL